jgi:hypothetical protein
MGDNGQVSTPNRGLTARENAPRTTVQDSLDKQSMGIKDLHETIQVLRERLVSVLSPSNPSSDANAKDTLQPSTLMERVNDNSRGIRAATSALHDLVDRLEI